MRMWLYCRFTPSSTCRSTVSRLMAFTMDTSMPDSSMLAGRMSTPSAWWSIASSAWIGSSMSARPMSVDSVTGSASGWGQPRLIVKLACGSQSTSRTCLPSCASPMPRLAQVVVLPTPPFWLAIDRMVGCKKVTSKKSRVCKGNGLLPILQGCVRGLQTAHGIPGRCCRFRNHNGSCGFCIMSSRKITVYKTHRDP